MAVKISKRIKDILAKDSKLMINTTKDKVPFVAARGGGDFAWDIDGNKFIDFSSFISVYNLGDEANKKIQEAITTQSKELIHAAFTDYYSEKPLQFAEKLMTMFPKGFGRTFFSNSGTEANEGALKLARLYSKRQYMFSFYGGFHGRTIGSLSLTVSKHRQREGFGDMFGPTLHAPYAYCYRCPFKLEYPSCGLACVDYIKKYPLSKEANPKDVAAIFMEPIQGEGGYVVPPKEFVVEMRKIADEHGILLISDEVQAGFMRTGKFLAMDNFGVEADIYTMAKAFAGGVPIGATVARNSLGNIPKGALSNTFGGNLVAIAAANASLDYIKKNESNLKSGISRKGKYIMTRLKDMLERYEIIGDVRGIGMMIGVEFVKDKKSKKPAQEERDKVIETAFYNNLLMLPCGESSLRVIPTLTMADKNIEEGMDILENAIKKVNGSR